MQNGNLTHVCLAVC